MIQIEMSAPSSTNLFGFFHFFHKFSPFSLLSSRNRLLRYLSLLLTVAIILLMLFRFYWMIWEIEGDFLSFPWAESKMFGFISLESAIITIALGKMGWTRSLEMSEKNINELKTLRIEKTWKAKDNYRFLSIRSFFANLFVFITFTLTSLYLAINKEVIMGSQNHSSWYWIMDPIGAILCGYVNFLFLPIHTLRAHAVTREFEIFNEEMEKADKEKKLVNLPILREFGARQIKLFEYTNFLTERMERFMIVAPALSLLSFLMVAFIVTQYSKTPPTLYLICLIAYLISTFIINYALMAPVALIQEAMSATSKVLLSSQILQDSEEHLIFYNYHMILDRCLHNRAENHVLRLFSVTRTNVERLFFFHSVMIIIMVFVNDLDNGIATGFQELGKLIMMNGTH